MKPYLFLVALTLTSALTHPAVAQTRITGTARVVDGDTLDLYTPAKVRVRLHGIDAPELKQTCVSVASKPYPCGQVASDVLTGLIANRPVMCVVIAKDRHRRSVAKCYVEELDLAVSMVMSGWAVAYRHYSQDYVPDEVLAQATRRGIWSGTFDNPAFWRANKPQ